jgi:hypothetical protein
MCCGCCVAAPVSARVCAGIVAYLKAGRPVIANVMNGGHFVLVVGYDAVDGDTCVCCARRKFNPLLACVQCVCVCTSLLRRLLAEHSCSTPVPPPSPFLSALAM